MDNLLTKVQEHQRNHPNHFSDDYRLELIRGENTSPTFTNRPTIHEFANGLTVAELKVLIRDWPETNAFDVEHKVGGGDISE